MEELNQAPSGQQEKPKYRPDRSECGRQLKVTGDYKTDRRREQIRLAVQRCRNKANKPQKPRAVV